MSLHRLICTASIIGLLYASTGSANAKGISSEDFVQKASLANMFEIETSKLALEKTSNDDVKEVAQHMIDEHTETGKELDEALADSGTDLKPETELDAKHQALYDALAAQSDAAFDKKYVAIQKDAHKEAVTLFSVYSKNGDNTALKAFAAQTLPALQKHLKRVKQVNLH